MYTMISVDGTQDLFDATGEVVGEEMAGWMAELAVHVLPLIMETEQDVVVFVRMEQFNTQDSVTVDAQTADDANDRQVLAFGAAYYPHPNVALKIDHERWENEADAKESRTNLGAAFMY
jgi:hypothetical protein